MKEKLDDGEKAVLRRALSNMNGVLNNLTNNKIYITAVSRSEEELRSIPNAMGGVNCFEKQNRAVS